MIYLYRIRWVALLGVLAGVALVVGQMPAAQLRVIPRLLVLWSSSIWFDLLPWGLAVLFFVLWRSARAGATTYRDLWREELYKPAAPRRAAPRKRARR